MFSPIVAIWWETACSTVLPGSPANGCCRSSSTVAIVDASACSASARAKSWNFGLRATKSVSQLSSSTTLVAASPTTMTAPSEALRWAFFEAAARPFVRRISIAAFMSPSASVRAFLQSIMPAPVSSRSSFTAAAVIAMLHLF